MTLEEEKTEPFSEINKILESLKKRDVAPALQWAVKHKDYLEKQVRNCDFNSNENFPTVLTSYDVLEIQPRIQIAPIAVHNSYSARHVSSS